jgi:hypothetical protein
MPKELDADRKRRGTRDDLGRKLSESRLEGREKLLFGLVWDVIPHLAVPLKARRGFEYGPFEACHESRSTTI